MEEIKTQLESIIIDFFDLDSFSLTEEVTIEEIEDWDSLSHVRVIIEIESHFDIKLSTNEVSELKKPYDLINLIESYTASR